MPFALIVIGLLLIVSGARGTYPQLKALLIKDFTGQHNFMQWIVAVGAVGLLGYIPPLEKFSRAMLTLVIISIFLAERGFFNKFSQALSSIQPNTATGNTSTGTAASGGVAGAVSAIDNATGLPGVGSIVSGILGR